MAIQNRLGCAVMTIALMAALPAGAQDPGATSKADGEARVMGPTERRVSVLLGKPVVDAEGVDIGEVDDFILTDGGTLEAVLAIGGIAGLGEKRVLVPLDALQFEVSEGEPGDEEAEPTIRLREMTGRQLADSKPPFRYEPD